MCVKISNTNISASTQQYSLPIGPAAMSAFAHCQSQSKSHSPSQQSTFDADPDMPVFLSGVWVGKHIGIPTTTTAPQDDNDNDDGTSISSGTGGSFSTSDDSITTRQPISSSNTIPVVPRVLEPLVSSERRAERLECQCKCKPRVLAIGSELTMVLTLTPTTTAPTAFGALLLEDRCACPSFLTPNKASVTTPAAANPFHTVKKDTDVQRCNNKNNKRGRNAVAIALRGSFSSENMHLRLTNTNSTVCDGYVVNGYEAGRVMLDGRLAREGGTDWWIKGRVLVQVALISSKDTPMTNETNHALVHTRKSEESIEVDGFVVVSEFFLRLEPDDSDLHCSGLWVGSSVPDLSLAPFMIPTNPIRWALSLIQVTGYSSDGIGESTANSHSSSEQGIVFGSGFFDDAADVANQPTLFFTLLGSCNLRTGAVMFDKIYEPHCSTAGYVVAYRGMISVRNSTSEKSTKSTWLTGQWINEKAASFGDFRARLQTYVTSSTSHIFLCDACQQPIKPGETRWSCSECPVPWTCCDGCRSGASLSSEELHVHSLCPDVVFELEAAQGVCCAKLAHSALQKFAFRPLLGLSDLSESKTGRSFRWLTYGDVANLARPVAVFLRKLFLHTPVHPGKNIAARHRVLFCADTSANFVVALLAVLLEGGIIVPIHAASDDLALAHVLGMTEPCIAFVSTVHVPRFQRVANASKHAACVIVDMEDDASHEKAVKSILTFSQIRDDIQGSYAEFHPPSLRLDDITAVLFTSGSTGAPKGAVFTEELSLPSEGIVIIQPFVRLDFQRFDPSFLLSLLSTMQCGGSRALCTDLQHLYADIRAVRPTHLGATPVFWNSLFNEFHALVKQQLTADENLSDRSTVEKKVSASLRNSLGNRLYVATSGGAPISRDVLKFVRSRLGIDIVDMYGCREVGGIAREGIVYKGVDVQLVSLPELGYFTSRDPPRGEVCVRSPRMIPGYFNDEENNAKSFVIIDGLRYYRTGDVGEIVRSAQETRLRVIDRSSFFFKLSQGEWVSPGRIELVIEALPTIDMALVVGDSRYAFCICLISPSDILRSFHLAHDLASCTCIQSVLSDIRFACVHEHLKPIEIPQQAFIDFEEPWSENNGLLTGTQKKLRSRLASKYRTIVDELYNFDVTQPSQTFSQAASSHGLSNRFVDLLARVLPQANIWAKDANVTLSEIGGDSMSAANLSKLIADATGGELTVPPSMLYEYSLSHLSMLIERFLQGKVSCVDSSMVGTDIDWSCEAELPSWVRFPKALLGESSYADAPPCIFVTGSTGFLGPVIIAKFLSSQVFINHDMYCLVRRSRATAMSSTSERKRLITDLRRTGLWEAAMKTRLNILIGDLTIEHFGLSDSDFACLAARTAVIVHSGAMVNMTMPYRGLKDANVTGTLRVLELAMLTRRCAEIHYISSVGALPNASRLGKMPPEDWVDVDAVDMTSKSGYGQTKAVCERILHKAVEELSLDIRVYRPSAISFSHISGFSNPNDLTNILLLAIIKLKQSVREATLRLRWVPVDIVASAIVAVAGERARNRALAQRIFHLCGQGPSLSDVVGYLRETEGYNIDSTLSVSEWRTALEKFCQECKSVNNEHVQKLQLVLPALSNMQFLDDTNSMCLPVKDTEDVLERLLGSRALAFKITENGFSLACNYLRHIHFFPPVVPYTVS